jgi:16S rRNA processing protein RimM
MTSSARSETPPPTDGLIVGEVVGPFGVAGEVKLHPLTDFPERLRRYRRLVLALPDGSWREVRVRRARPHKNLWLLKLWEVTTPEEVEALRGAQAIVRADLVEPLPQGHFYLHDVIGLRAVTAAGEDLGTVTDVLRSPANDIYVVGKLLIPAIKEIVERIDPAAGLLVVRSKEALASVEVAELQGEG